MYPISNERLSWLEARIFLLGRMINELTLRQSRYQVRPQYAAQHGNVMTAMIAEQLQLNIEKNSIEEYLEGERELKIARDQAALDNGTHPALK